LAALDLANQFEPVLMCTPAMREASVIDEPAAMAAKNLALSSGATLRLVPMWGIPYFFLGSLLAPIVVAAPSVPSFAALFTNSCCLAI
jgi:hypothetical protein